MVELLRAPETGTPTRTGSSAHLSLESPVLSLSETYLCIGPLNSQSEAESVLSYLSCRLTRLFILLHKPSQDTTRKVYTFVPTQDWTKNLDDEALYAKYGITEEEQAFIEKIVRPMDLSGRADE